MVAMTDHIGQFRVDGQHYKVVTGTFSIKSVMSFDVDIREKFAYIGDSVGNSIVRVSLENRTKLEHIVKSVRKPEGIAFDWISRKIFWSSSHPKCKQLLFMVLLNSLFNESCLCRSPAESLCYILRNWTFLVSQLKMICALEITAA